MKLKAVTMFLNVCVCLSLVQETEIVKQTKHITLVVPLEHSMQPSTSTQFSKTENFIEKGKEIL